MDRRSFFKTSLASASLVALSQFENAYAKGKADALVGNVWKGWSKGHFQIHFIYTGVCESAFYIFPDGTTMLLDCGDHDAIGRGKLAVPVLPHAGRHAGEWIARYVQRVNPNGNVVDYAMLSHYHSDHGGCMKFYDSKKTIDGKEYVMSGFIHAAQTLRFGKAFDRAWPTFDDPLPMADDFDSGSVVCIRQFYEYGQKYQDMKVEKFRLGATDQIVPLRNPAQCSDFKVRNICANGRLCAEDGTVTDLYAERIRKDKPKSLNENGMSLGMVFSYGPFRFFTAGDFSDGWKLEDGTSFQIEDAIADVCGRANVAKINHHGHNSMTRKLIGELRSQVYVSCVWDQLHNLTHVMDLVADRTIYPEDRIICPGILPPERRAQDEGKPWMNDVPVAAYEGSHIILDVEPGGRNFSINFLSAADESMTVKSVLKFKTEKR